MPFPYIFQQCTLCVFFFPFIFHQCMEGVFPYIYSCQKDQVHHNDQAGVYVSKDKLTNWSLIHILHKEEASWKITYSWILESFRTLSTQEHNKRRPNSFFVKGQPEYSFHQCSSFLLDLNSPSSMKPSFLIFASVTLLLPLSQKFMSWLTWDEQFCPLCNSHLRVLPLHCSKCNTTI